MGRDVIGVKLPDGLAEKVRFHNTLALALEAIKGDLKLSPAQIIQFAHEKGLSAEAVASATAPAPG